MAEGLKVGRTQLRKRIAEPRTKHVRLKSRAPGIKVNNLIRDVGRIHAGLNAMQFKGAPLPARIALSAAATVAGYKPAMPRTTKRSPIKRSPKGSA